MAYKSGTETEGVSIRLKKIDLEGDLPRISVEFINDTDVEIACDSKCNIYLVNGEEKIDCIKADAIWDESYYHLLPHRSMVIGYPLDNFDLSSPGYYRLETEYEYSSDTYTAWIEFEVSEKEELMLSSKITEITTGTVLFYGKPTVEYKTPDIKYYNKFSEKDFEIFLSSLKANKWIFDGLTDRINFNYDVEIHCDNGYRIYFGFEQRIVYCNEYYSTLTNEQIIKLKEMRKSAEEIESSDSYTQVVEGNTETYVFENSVDPLKPSLTLNKDKKAFTFSYSVFSNYFATGSYRWEGDTLILSADDKIHGYVFEKENDDTLVFDGTASSSIPEYKYSGANKAPQSPVPNGAVFELRIKTET